MHDRALLRCTNQAIPPTATIKNMKMRKKSGDDVANVHKMLRGQYKKISWFTFYRCVRVWYIAYNRNVNPTSNIYTNFGVFA